MSSKTPSKVARQLEVGLSLIGVPYLWWAKGDDMGIIIDGKFVKVPSPAFAFDCSGGVTYPVWRAGGPDLRWSHNTDTLWTSLPPTRTPVPGDFSFYGGKGPEDVDHVMTVLSILHTGEIVVMGPSSGDRSTTTLDRAKEQDARWKVKTSHMYRADFRGFRKGYFT